jgi:ATP-dependent Clp protease ATP-binding subunit ClpA
MFERFTDSAREAVVQAQAAAKSLGHRYIGTEHLLLGLLADSESDSARCLWLHRVDHDQVREALVRIIPAPPGDPLPTAPVVGPFDPGHDRQA